MKNKVVIITGAANGIGRATALEMARKKAKLVLVDIDNKSLKKVFEQITHLGREAIAIKADVTKEKDVIKVIKKAKKTYKKIDILVNNAGSMILKTIDELEEKEWEHVIKTNLKGAYLFIKNLANHMKENKKGKIVNIASTAGIIGLKNSSAHAAANGGVISLTRQLAIELSPYKINVNVVSPGIIATSLTEAMLNDAKTKEELLSHIPMNRVGTPEEVAEAIVFLASTRSDFITGHNLVVDGGWLTH